MGNVFLCYCLFYNIGFCVRSATLCLTNYKRVKTITFMFFSISLKRIFWMDSKAFLLCFFFFVRVLNTLSESKYRKGSTIQRIVYGCCHQAIISWLYTSIEKRRKMSKEEINFSVYGWKNVSMWDENANCNTITMAVNYFGAKGVIYLRKRENVNHQNAFHFTRERFEIYGNEKWTIYL